MTHPRLSAWNDVFGSIADATSLLTAMEIGVFETLRAGAASGEALAEAAGVTASRLRPTLDLVVACGFLERTGDLYALPPGDDDFYDPDGDGLRRLGASDLKGMFLRRARTVEVLRSDEPIVVAGTGGGVSEAERRAFLSYLHHASIEVAEQVAALTKGLDVRRVADLGGGAGTYTHALLRAHPEAIGVLVDRPNAEAVVRDFAEAAGLSARVQFLAVDFFFEDFGDDFDVVVLSNLVHCYGPEDNVRLLRRVRDRLAPGGRVLVKDLTLANDRSGPRTALRFGTSMALFTEGGDVWSESDIRTWFDAVGLEHVGTDAMVGDGAEHQVVTGRRP
jgi:SAM-dependent methyltransferase